MIMLGHLTVANQQVNVWMTISFTRQTQVFASTFSDAFVDFHIPSYAIADFSVPNNLLFEKNYGRKKYFTNFAILGVKIKK